MTSPYLGEVKLMPWSFAPRGWAFCAGQILSIQQYTALFSLLGTTYGGNGTTTFALPDLRGRVPIHRDQQGQYPQGEMEGEEQETLSLSEMPAHSHAFVGTSANGGAKIPTGTILATSSTAANMFYAADTSPLQPLSPASVSTIGGSQPHQNMQPYLTMNYCIALVGMYPARN